MTAPRRRIDIEPYNLTWAQVAEAVFQRSENWLRANLHRYVERHGFPPPDPRFDEALFNRAAIEAWLSGPYQASTTPAANIEQEMMDAAARGA